MCHHAHGPSKADSIWDLPRLLGNLEQELNWAVGPVVGTRFMAPEQAQGLNEQVGVQSDVWAVGAILFEC